jgi:hypothetical protein
MLSTWIVLLDGCGRPSIMTDEMINGGLTMAELDREKIAADWATRGFSCDLWTDPPGQRWEDFRHATDELIILPARFAIRGLAKNC